MVGQTPLSWARENNYENVIKLLTTLNYSKTSELLRSETSLGYKTNHSIEGKLGMIQMHIDEKNWKLSTILQFSKPKVPRSSRST